jgi:hypothetical protein
VSLAPIAEAVEDAMQTNHAASERAYPDRLYRLLSRQIDQACDRVELVNLGGGSACPDDVARFVGYLQQQAGELVVSPRTSTQAHDELMRLSCVLLGRPEGDLDIDIEAAAAERGAER